MARAEGDNTIDEGDDEVFYASNGINNPPRSSSSMKSKTLDRYGFIRSTGEEVTLQEIMPREVYVKREKKWIDMMSDWDSWMSKRFSKVKQRCRKGIPHSVRGKAWQLLSRSNELRKRHATTTYQNYLDEQLPAKVAWEITQDLHRSFPNHHMFSEVAGQKTLYNVLHAYAAYNPKEGFCQAHAPIASVLLMHMHEEEAFWCLVALSRNYLPDYYSGQLEEVTRDGEVLIRLLKRINPKLYKKMLSLRIDGPLFMVEWFLCIYSRDLPWPSVLRIWDIFFCEGVKILFRVALVLLDNSTRHLAKIPNDFYDLLSCLKVKNMPQEILQPDFLLEECFKLNVTDGDMTRVHKKVMKQKVVSKPSKAQSSHT